MKVGKLQTLLFPPKTSYISFLCEKKKVFVRKIVRFIKNIYEKCRKKKKGEGKRYKLGIVRAVNK